MHCYLNMIKNLLLYGITRARQKLNEPLNLGALLYYK